MAGLFTGFALIDWPNQNKWHFCVDVVFAVAAVAASFMPSHSAEGGTK